MMTDEVHARDASISERNHSCLSWRKLDETAWVAVQSYEINKVKFWLTLNQNIVQTRLYSAKAKEKELQPNILSQSIFNNKLVITNIQ